MFVSIFKTVSRLSVHPVRYCACYCPTEPFDPGVQVTYLPNGVRVMTEENYSPITCVSLFVTVGSKYEAAEVNGITHFIEHLVYKGFKTMNRLQVENYIFSMGAKVSVKTEKELQTFSVVLPSNRAPDAVFFLFRILNELSLDPYELQMGESDLCLQAIDSENNPKEVVFEHLHATAFQGTRLAQSIIGPLCNRTSFDRDTVAEFFCKNYSPCRLLLATSGMASHEKIIDAACRSFGQLPPGPVWGLDEGPSRFTGSEVIYRNDSMPFAHAAIAFEAPGYNNPDYWPMLVASCLIGSWDKSQGRSDNQPFYVAQGAATFKCESYESFYIPYKDVGLWGAYFVADGSMLDDLVHIIQDAWMQMSVISSSAECARAVNMAKMKVARKYDGVVNSCQDMGEQMMFACRRKPIELALDLVNTVQPYKLRQMGQRYLYNQAPAVVAMGPTETFPDYNRTLSGMYWLRW